MDIDRIPKAAMRYNPKEKWAGEECKKDGLSSEQAYSFNHNGDNDNESNKKQPVYRSPPYHIYIQSSAYQRQKIDPV